MKENTKGTQRTCYKVRSKHNVQCDKKKCRHWINYPKGCNCVLATTFKMGSLTLQEIGKIFDMSRMRVCQIERRSFEIMKEELEANLENQTEE